MISMNNDSATITTQSYLERVRQQQETVNERLVSGQRINKAADDAAGLAIAMKMAAELAGGEQGYRNLNDAVSMAQTADGALGNVSDSLQRMRELSVQASSPLLNPSDRGALQSEVSQLQAQLGETLNQAGFNGVNPLAQSGTLAFQLGGANQSVEMRTFDAAGELGKQGTNTIDIGSEAGANSAIAILDSAMAYVSDVRGEFGATLNRFDSAARHLQGSNNNLAESKSRIMDADYARESTEQARTMILANVGNAMLVQGNKAMAAGVASLLG